MSARLVLGAIAVIALSGVPGLLMNRRSGVGQWVATSLMVAGAGLGMVGALSSLISPERPEMSVAWPVPGGEFHIAIDAISVVFLLPILLIPTLGSIYGLGYWNQSEHPGNGRKLRLFYGLVTASLALVVISANAVLFLAAWEIMALAAFFLVTTEDEDAAVRDVGWVYLVATHTATLILFAMFAMLRNELGSFSLTPLAEGLVPGRATMIFLLAMAGFGLKAGIMPLHIWLPGAHAMAPSHVSALLSGVLIKVGIYGIVRITSFLPNPPLWWGGLLLLLGAISGVWGVALAIGQHDLKRLLAYHSVENIGIIVMGIGLALIGRSMNRLDWIVLGLAGALLHVWNHGLFKALLFLSAGSVIHAVHTRDIDCMGGLAKRMPRTAFCFAIGAVAICGLPPLNGFVSELFIYIGLFRTLGIGDGTAYVGAALAAPALALIGALAVACFVKAYGSAFLGTGRTEQVRHVHESGASMIGPMLVLVTCCSVIGLAPPAVVPLLDRAISAWMLGRIGEPPLLGALAPVWFISVMGTSLLAILAVGTTMLLGRIRTGTVATSETWACGYAGTSPRIQYTSSSFAEMLVRMFARVLRPKIESPHDSSLFVPEGRFHTLVPDFVLDSVIRPSFQVAAWLTAQFRIVQQGIIQAYLFYIFVILLVLLLWQGIR